MGAEPPPACHGPQEGRCGLRARPGPRQPPLPARGRQTRSKKCKGDAGPHVGFACRGSDYWPAVEDQAVQVAFPRAARQGHRNAVSGPVPALAQTPPTPGADRRPGRQTFPASALPRQDFHSLLANPLRFLLAISTFCPRSVLFRPDAHRRFCRAKWPFPPGPPAGLQKTQGGSVAGRLAAHGRFTGLPQTAPPGPAGPAVPPDTSPPCRWRSPPRCTPKLTIWAVENGSWNATTASRNWRVGERYWRMPIVDSRSFFAAAPKNSSGIVVTGPLSARGPGSKAAPRPLPRRPQVAKVGQGDGRHGERLHRQAHQPVHGHDLPHQAVQAERQGQGQGNPGHPPTKPASTRTPTRASMMLKVWRGPAARGNTTPRSTLTSGLMK